MICYQKLLVYVTQEPCNQTNMPADWGQSATFKPASLVDIPVARAWSAGRRGARACLVKDVRTGITSKPTGGRLQRPQNLPPLARAFLSDKSLLHSKPATVSFSLQVTRPSVQSRRVCFNVKCNYCCCTCCKSACRTPVLQQRAQMSSP